MRDPQWVLLVRKQLQADSGAQVARTRVPRFGKSLALGCRNINVLLAGVG